MNKLLRLQVLKRDNYICQNCLKDRKIQIHGPEEQEI